MMTHAQQAPYQTIQDWNRFDNQRVLVRVDFNVPLDANRQVTDDTRIRETLPTLRYLVERGARVIVVSHLGRPKGKVDDAYRLAPVVERLRTLMAPTEILAASEVVSPAVSDAVNRLKPGQILVLENVRFEPGEEKNDATLAQQLASLADIYVNDAFGTAHRAHASTEGVAHHVPVALAGLLMDKEIRALTQVLAHPEHPYTAIIGGSKVSTKITVLERLLEKVDTLVIGGAMVFSFLKAQGYSVGASLVEEEYLPVARKLLEQAQTQGTRILLAEDVVVADGFKADAEARVVSIEAIPDGWMGLDIGPNSIAAIQEILKASKLVLWNGPLGVFEFPRFAEGTRVVAQTLADLTRSGQLTSVLGGGDTVAAIEQFQFPPEAFSHVSSGGGASLEFLEGKTLPGIAILQSKQTAASRA
jgi:phosphoglycerate kinase